jgi:N-acetyl-alpha-D-muramate 1-phosphate uridylyltransferase
VIHPRTAMVLAAGLGTRMRPLTEHTAKPLLLLAGRTLLDHALDRLAEAGVETVVVNAHWHADKVAAHLAARLAPPRTVLRRESTLLDTGGAVLAALDVLGDNPFYVVNGDSVWHDGPGTRALLRLAEAWEAGVDAILMLQRTDNPRGDFFVDADGRTRRFAPTDTRAHLYNGMQLLHPRLFAAPPGDKFSMNALWDRAIATGRIRGVVHDGAWFHLSTPPDLAAAEAALA